MIDPLVVTLAIDDAVQARWDRQRRALFPIGRTQVGAHVTLFHKLPAELETDVRQDLHDLAGGMFEVTVSDVVALGQGAAYQLESAELARRHRELQRRWWPHLTAQDRQGFRPHVTVQNKVAPAAARDTLARLRGQFVPYEVMALGFELWRYVGGPWEPVTRIRFGDGPDAPQHSGKASRRRQSP